MLKKENYIKIFKDCLTEHCKKFHGLSVFASDLKMSKKKKNFFLFYFFFYLFVLFLL